MHPYTNLPDQNFWKRFVANTPWRDVELGASAKFKLSASSKIATAGSCFAQHIARYLNKAGRSTYIAETPHPLMLEFGGGGHENAGTCQVDNDKAAGVLAELIEKINADG